MLVKEGNSRLCPGFYTARRTLQPPGNGSAAPHNVVIANKQSRAAWRPTDAAIWRTRPNITSSGASVRSHHYRESHCSSIADFWATVRKNGSPYAIGPLSCLSCPQCPVCDVGVLWPNGWSDQDETWHAGSLGLGPGHIVLDGDPAPPQKRRVEPPNFRPISIAAKRLQGSRCHLVRR